MADVLRMTALQVRHPVALLILMEADDAPWHSGGCSGILFHSHSRAGSTIKLSCASVSCSDGFGGAGVSVTPAYTTLVLWHRSSKRDLTSRA
jgi:hypothetical protein